jgi:formate dehydrogenase major subunit
MAQTDYWLEMQGRPSRCATTRPPIITSVQLGRGVCLIGRHLQALDSPHQAEFYTSGRTPNEAAFLYSIFVREFGTNNFPDCSNMCHEPTSRGLPPAIGVGKGTIVLQDFEHAEAIFVIGQNTGTNSPRMMSNLVEARKRGIPIVAVNPMPERALIRFAEPQDMVQMATFGSTEITSEFVHIRIGGDLALIKGMMKVMFEREAQGERVLDHDFLSEHTVGLEALREDVLAQDWDQIVQVSGITRPPCAEIYIRSKATVICYGMGLTQHQYGSRLLQQVQPAVAARQLRQARRRHRTDPWPFQCAGRPHRRHRREAQAGLSGPRAAGVRLRSAARARPSCGRVDRGDAGRQRQGVHRPGRQLHPCRARYTARVRGDARPGADGRHRHQAQSGHLVHGRDALILPVVARSERIVTPAGEQFVTIEDAMSNVTASRGVLEPVSAEVLPGGRDRLPHGDGHAAAQQGRLGRCMHDYTPIRELIAAVYPEIYTGFNERIQQPHGFHLDIPPRRRVWPTPNGKANILVMPGLDVDEPVDDPEMLRLATVRSHDQYNTTIYSYNDRYRGVYNDRMVLFMNIEDRLARGLEKEALVSLETISGDGVSRRIEGLTVLDYPMPRGALAGYYPELNPLLPLDYYDRISGTPAAKSIPVRMRAMAAATA